MYNIYIYCCRICIFCCYLRRTGNHVLKDHTQRVERFQRVFYKVHLVCVLLRPSLASELCPIGEKKDGRGFIKGRNRVELSIKHP